MQVKRRSSSVALHQSRQGFTRSMPYQTQTKMHLARMLRPWHACCLGFPLPHSSYHCLHSSLITYHPQPKPSRPFSHHSSSRCNSQCSPANSFRQDQPRKTQNNTKADPHCQSASSVYKQDPASIWQASFVLAKARRTTNRALKAVLPASI